MVPLGQFVIAWFMRSVSSPVVGGVNPLGASGIVSPAWPVVQAARPASIVAMLPCGDVNNPAFFQLGHVSLYAGKTPLVGSAFIDEPPNKSASADPQQTLSTTTIAIS